jgi:hypothetical protein
VTHTGSDVTSSDVTSSDTTDAGDPADAGAVGVTEGAEAETGSAGDAAEGITVADIGRDGPVTVLFTAAWCVAGTLLERHVAVGDDVLIIDVDRRPDLADQLNVAAVPCVLIIENGTVRRRIVGAAVIDALTPSR